MTAAGMQACLTQYPFDREALIDHSLTTNSRQLSSLTTGSVAGPRLEHLVYALVATSQQVRCRLGRTASLNARTGPGDANPA